MNVTLEENEDGIFFALGRKRIRPLEKTALKKGDEVEVHKVGSSDGMLFDVKKGTYSETWGIKFLKRTIFEKTMEKSIAGL
jgi:hypothetical protein